MTPASGPVLSPPMVDLIQDHLDRLKLAIFERAQELALREASNSNQKGNRPTVSPLHCLSAIRQIAPGEATTLVKKPVPFWHRFANSMSPITLISALLTIVFASFGLWALGHNPDPKNGSLDGRSYLDIAKIFAGAIVGSASVAAASTRSPLTRTTKKGSRSTRKS